jgi:hypothetical protein
MIWITGIVLAGICVFLLIVRGMKGPVKTLETIEGPIADLLKRGYNGAFLIIDISRTKYFIQLRKYINEPGMYGIELCFPNASWSINIFQKLIEFCKYEEIKASITKKNDKESLEFLCVDFGQDSQAAYKFVRRILLEIFKVDETAKLFVRLENAATEDILIDS